jgi:hypothetical protein
MSSAMGQIMTYMGDIGAFKKTRQKSSGKGAGTTSIVERGMLNKHKCMVT